jgi:hypothetical protein
MINFSTQFSGIKDNLESVAFLVSKGSSEREAHAKIVQSLVLLSQIEFEINNFLKKYDFNDKNTPELKITNPLIREEENNSISMGNNTNNIAVEIEKVKRRVPRWFKNPNQYNSTILYCFLELSEFNSQITIQMLRDKCNALSDFDGNYNQMKNFGEKNHGKVFEESNGIITLWEPVKENIMELYKKTKSTPTGPT